MLHHLKAWFKPAAGINDDAGYDMHAELERLRGENELLKAESQRYANIINSSPHLVWMRDATLKIVYCNLAFAEVAEATTDDVVSIGEVELFKGHRAMVDTAWKTGKEMVERRHVIVGGERRLYTIREVPMPREGIVIGYGTHISDLEEAQDEIQRHISALRDLLESSTSAMAIYGPDQRLKFFNFAFVTLWKLDESWLNTEPSYGEVLELLREKRRLPEQANFKAFKDAQLRQFTTLIATEEEFFYLPDGKTLRVIAIPHALGGILFAYEDVTDRLALERSYNTLIAVQRETLDNLHEGIVVFGENGRLRLSNPTFQEMWGISAEFATGEPHLREVLDACRDLFVAHNRETYLADLTSRFQQRRFFHLRFERSDGNVIDCSCVPLPDGATLLSFVDVTDSTLVERSLRERTEALEAADRLKTEFLANMSYELRSPLTSISGFAEMLGHEEYVGKLNERQKEYVDGIYQSARSLGALISDIIDLATIEAGYLKLEIASFDPRAAITAAINLMKEQIRYQNLKAELQFDTALAEMHADETRFKQIVMNLVANAVKVTKAKGVITLSLAREGDAICLTVHDDGPGLDAARKAHLFDPFFRGIAGHGSEAALSLSLVKRFVELHGGTVIVDSEEGCGTSIRCYFPESVQPVVI